MDTGDCCFPRTVHLYTVWCVCIATAWQRNKQLADHQDTVWDMQHSEMSPTDQWLSAGHACLPYSLMNETWTTCSNSAGVAADPWLLGHQGRHWLQSRPPANWCLHAWLVTRANAVPTGTDLPWGEGKYFADRLVSVLFSMIDSAP